jgi:hypothetical protein
LKLIVKWARKEEREERREKRKRKHELGNFMRDLMGGVMMHRSDASPSHAMPCHAYAIPC